MRPFNEPDPFQQALARLREETNPFLFAIATVGTEQDCLQFDVPDLLDSQRSDLLTVVGLYRSSHQPSRVIPILGPYGSGKTHLLTTFQAELQLEAEATGEEYLLVIAEHSSRRLDAIDFFYRHVVNHLLEQRGSGARLLRVVSDRLTARLLAEALRRLAPHRQVRLIPPQGLWRWLGSKIRPGRFRERRLATVRRLIDRCDATYVSGLPHLCGDAGLSCERAFQVTAQLIEDTEPNDLVGTLREDLYIRLVRLALLGDRAPIEDFLNEVYDENPVYSANVGSLSRRLLDVFLELFRELGIPVILAFDQLEDFLNAPTEEQRRAQREVFGQQLASIVNHVPGICLLIFAEEGLWTETILAGLDPYARQRIDQRFSLPGRPAQQAVLMPTCIPQSDLHLLIQRRVRSALGDFDPTGLSPIFPFREEHLACLASEITVRNCLRRLVELYDQVVFGEPQPSAVPPPPPAPGLPPPPSSVSTTAGQTTDPAETLRTRLRARWQIALARARKVFEGDGQPRPSRIPMIQNALDRWLIDLQDRKIAGTDDWAKVELLQRTSLGNYGYLNVIRLENPDAPGIGIAVWMAEGRGRLTDLQRRLEFFEQLPCPLRTLALLRADGTKALNGESGKVYKEAIQNGRDVLVQEYEQGDLDTILAFSRWLHDDDTEADVRAAGSIGDEVLLQYASELSSRLLLWIDGWRMPRTGCG